MDNCMLTPSERADLQKLLRELEKTKTRVLIYLSAIEAEWAKEAAKEDRQSERMELPLLRLDILSGWIEKLEYAYLSIEEIDELPDEREE